MIKNKEISKWRLSGRWKTRNLEFICMENLIPVCIRFAKSGLKGKNVENLSTCPMIRMGPSFIGLGHAKKARRNNMIVGFSLRFQNHGMLKTGLRFMCNVLANPLSRKRSVGIGWWMKNMVLGTLSRKNVLR